jgi:uncharacterized protein (TIGR02757 family)
MEMDRQTLKSFLDEKAEEFNRPAFIQSDPVQVAHQFSGKEDVEIAGFLSATIAWGNRTAIINNALRLMQMMDNEPFNFTLNASPSELSRLKKFIHRTFNGDDSIYFIHSLRNIYVRHAGLQNVFESGFEDGKTVCSALTHFHRIFFELPGERTQKHVPNVEKGASAKRLNMFLRWMVRNDKAGVDFGLWKGIPKSALMLPLDVHTGNVGRKLGLLQRRSNDWKAVEEITSALRSFDPEDPVKYDFALFGLGVFEKF